MVENCKHYFHRFGSFMFLPFKWYIRMKNRLREIRLSKDLTLEEVAQKAGTSNQQILRLEKGQRRLTTDWIRRLAKALNVAPSEIVPALEDELLSRINALETQEREIVAALVDSLLAKHKSGKRGS